MDACSLWAGGPRLGDMPTEMIDVIASHLARARDAVSYYVALGQSPTRALTERVLADPVAFLAAGAPLDITQTLLDRMRTGVPVPFDWVEAAVYGGQQGVITTVWTRASVDTAADLYRFEWRRVGRGRWRRLFGQARCLLEAAVDGRGGADIVRYFLDIYDASRFDARPLFNQGLLGRLCRHAIKYGPDAVAVMTALHERRPKGWCACTAAITRDAVRADRADILARMCDWGCAARPRLDNQRRATALAVTAVEARAPSVIAWIGARAPTSAVPSRPSSISATGPT